MGVMSAKAREILDLASSAGVKVDRSYIAPGPAFAHDCSLIAVCFVRDSFAAIGAGSPIPGVGCAMIPRPIFRVTYVADCVPKPGDRGAPPAADDLTVFSARFMDDCHAIYDAVAAGLDMGTHEIGDGVPDRPLGTFIAYRFDVRAALLA